MDIVFPQNDVPSEYKGPPKKSSRASCLAKNTKIWKSNNTRAQRQGASHITIVGSSLNSSSTLLRSCCRPSHVDLPKLAQKRPNPAKFYPKNAGLLKLCRVFFFSLFWSRFGRQPTRSHTHAATPTPPTPRQSRPPTHAKFDPSPRGEGGGSSGGVE